MYLLSSILVGYVGLRNHLAALGWKTNSELNDCFISFAPNIMESFNIVPRIQLCRQWKPTMHDQSAATLQIGVSPTMPAFDNSLAKSYTTRS